MLNSPAVLPLSPVKVALLASQPETFPEGTAPVLSVMLQHEVSCLLALASNSSGVLADTRHAFQVLLQRCGGMQSDETSRAAASTRDSETDSIDAPTHHLSERTQGQLKSAAAAAISASLSGHNAEVLTQVVAARPERANSSPAFTDNQAPATQPADSPQDLGQLSAAHAAVRRPSLISRIFTRANPPASATTTLPLSIASAAATTVSSTASAPSLSSSLSARPTVPSPANSTQSAEVASSSSLSSSTTSLSTTPSSPYETADFTTSNAVAATGPPTSSAAALPALPAVPAVPAAPCVPAVPAVPAAADVADVPRQVADLLRSLLPPRLCQRCGVVLASDGTVVANAHDSSMCPPHAFTFHSDGPTSAQQVSHIQPPALPSAHSPATHSSSSRAQPDMTADIDAILGAALECEEGALRKAFVAATSKRSWYSCLFFLRAVAKHVQSDPRLLFVLRCLCTALKLTARGLSMQAVIGVALSLGCLSVEVGELSREAFCGSAECSTGDVSHDIRLQLAKSSPPEAVSCLLDLVPFYGVYRLTDRGNSNSSVRMAVVALLTTLQKSPDSLIRLGSLEVLAAASEKEDQLLRKTFSMSDNHRSLLALLNACREEKVVLLLLELQGLRLTTNKLHFTAA